MIIEIPDNTNRRRGDAKWLDKQRAEAAQTENTERCQITSAIGELPRNSF